MFIVESIKKEDAEGELLAFYTMIEEQLGFLPSHFELFATFDLEAMKNFLNFNLKMMQHPKIQREVLPFLRLYIATKECRSYCTNFNTKIVLGMGIERELVQNITENLDQLPLEEPQKVLLKKVLFALQDPSKFGKKDLEELHSYSFSDNDFFDLLRYASEFNANSKMIEVFLES